MIKQEQQVVNVYKVGITVDLDTTRRISILDDAARGNTIHYQNEGSLRDFGVAANSYNTFLVGASNRRESDNYVKVGCQYYTYTELVYILSKVDSVEPPKMVNAVKIRYGKPVAILEESKNFYVLANGKAVVKTREGLTIVQIEHIENKGDIKISKSHTGSIEIEKYGHKWRIFDLEKFKFAASNVLALATLALKGEVKAQEAVATQ